MGGEASGIAPALAHRGDSFGRSDNRFWGGMTLPVTAPDLLKMSHAELDDLFRRAAPGPIPSGEGDGSVIFAPDRPIAEIAAKVARAVAWTGKVFDVATGKLRREVGPVGNLAIRAKVYREKSRFDGHEAIILDHGKTSLVAQWIRDEIREVAPGLYLGMSPGSTTRSSSSRCSSPVWGPDARSDRRLDQDQPAGGDYPRISQPRRVATLRLPRRAFDSPPQRAFADLLVSPWPSTPDHRPLSNHNRGLC